MNDFEIAVINNLTVETVSQSIINETSKWGFKQADYLKLINDLMDLSLNKPSVNQHNENLSTPTNE